MEEPPPLPERLYNGPPATVQILQMESYPVQYSASVDVVVPTGGWTLELDKGEVVAGAATVYMTLERPHQNEMVTQALVTHSKSFTMSTPFKKANVYIHLAQRGVQTLTTDYRLAVASDR